MSNDPRSTQGILSRGAPIYNGTGYGPYSGKMGQQSNLQNTAKSLLNPAKSLIPNTMDKVDYAGVAQKWLQQSLA